MEYDGKPVEDRLLTNVKQGILSGFIFLAIINSKDPKEQKALDRLNEIRNEVNDLMDVVVPWQVEL